jgi:hypothetical protein
VVQTSALNATVPTAEFVVRGVLHKRTNGKLVVQISSVLDAEEPLMEGGKFRKKFPTGWFEIPLGHTLIFGSSIDVSVHDSRYVRGQRGLSYEDSFFLLSVQSESRERDSAIQQKRRSQEWERVHRRRRTDWGKRMLGSIEQTRGVSGRDVELIIADFLRESDVSPCDIERSFGIGRLSTDVAHWGRAWKGDTESLSERRPRNFR